MDLSELSRGDIQKKLQACGGKIWRDFRQRRRLLEQGGMDAEEAHNVAVSEFKYHIETGSQLEDVPRETDEDGNEIRRTIPFGFNFPTCTMEDFEDRPHCPSVKALDWCFRFAAVRDVTVHECPDAGAWGMLGWMRQSPGNMTEFMSRIYTKRIPSRTQLDDGRGYADDGREELEQIDRILRLATQEDESAQASSVEKRVSELDKVLPKIVFTDDMGPSESDEDGDLPP